MSINKVIEIGRLTRRLELQKVGANQTSFTRGTIAVDRVGKDSGTDFINFVAWGPTAENTVKYTDQGRQIAIEGRLRSDKYQDKDGNTKYTLDVVAEKITFLGTGGGGASNGGNSGNAAANTTAPTPEPVNDEFAKMADEDIPF